MSTPTAWLAALTFSAVSCAVGIPLLSRLSRLLGLIDEPGGRKDHAHSVPLVGGLAIFIAVAGSAALVGHVPFAWFGAATLVVAVGAWDDAAELRPRTRFAAQILAACVMIAAAGVELRTVGDLLGTGRIGLWIFILPLTVFSVVGVVNSLNMLDGMDGLAGSTAFVALAWYALMAWQQGLSDAFAIAAFHAAALMAFLGFNLRFPWQPHARVFLGDAGSMLLGLALAWLAIDLTQGPQRTMPPIATLWVVLLPLADCVSIMVRRVRLGRSPFAPDREHIHHYLLARGFSHSATLGILVMLSTLFGAVGYFGWRWEVPEPVLFWTFFVTFFAYHFWIGQQWKRLRHMGPSEVLSEERSG